ncbi:DUF3854 domain-containing protein [Nostoc favosum]|uniref:DUF3854 domain-containing protein n=1 Tax=Nostoc favosum CHAB5714 TaxID=2780399 RepID=A0ABS8IMJ1_9NOSO|nr:DUF3854 domain-containing protein [Nostoc favosum]MCC5604708.1 DUF3854 domain-containing protein [Nostoc favosum CHAB5714]
MFDERSLNLITNLTVLDQRDYERTVKILDALIPILEASVERLQYEWDQLAHIEIGDDTYVLKPNEEGGYTWEKIDYFDNDWYEDEPEVDVDIGGEDVVNSPSLTTEQPQPESGKSTNITVQEVSTYTSTPKNIDEVPVISSSQLISSPSTNTNIQATSPSSPPEHIDPQHWKELVEDSAIDPAIAKVNFKSLHQDTVEQEHLAWEYLMYSPDISRRNDGRLRDGDLARYQHIEKGGWWCDAGVDPRSFVNLEPGDAPQGKLWGCYKPDQPRYDKEKPDKKIKYEHPPKTNLSIFLLEVPSKIANKIYSKAGVNPNQSDRQSGFWYCVWKYNIPVVVTEGAKKTAAILSQGDAAIGLPGINAGYRSYDQQQNPITPRLREEFAVFATQGRDFKICFDYETKAKTKKNVAHAIARTGELLTNAGANVSVVSLPGPEKGVDDLIVNSTEAYQKAIREAVPLKEWQQQNPPPDLRFTIFLKDGKEINLYEKQADGSVTSNPANLASEEIISLTQGLRENLVPLKKHIKSQNPINEFQVINDDAQNKDSLPKYWAEQRQVPNYAQNLPRKLLLPFENKQIALAAKKLIEQYGSKENDGSTLYRTEAFSIRKFGKKISIHRAVDENESYFSFPLMQFELDKKDKVAIIKPPLNMLIVERQEFLNIRKVDKLPSFYEDAKTLKHHLGSLAPLGTQKVIKNLETQEVSQLLTTILQTANSKHLQIGEYRIKSELNQQTGHSSIKLIKKDKSELERVAIEINPASNSVKIMKLSESDLNNLRLIAKRVHLEYSERIQQGESDSYSLLNINEPSANTTGKKRHSKTQNQPRSLEL